MIAFGAQKPREMTQVASALPTPNQPSRDHKVVTQRLPEGDGPRGSRGVRTRDGRTRHGGTKIGGRHDGSGWGGRGRRGACAPRTSAVMIATADSSSLDGAFEDRGLMMTGGVYTDNGHRRGGRRLGRGAGRVPFRLGEDGGFPRGNRAASTSHRGKVGRDAELPDRHHRDAPRGRVGASTRLGEGVELGGERGRHPARGKDVNIAGPDGGGEARPASGQNGKVGAKGVTARRG